MQERPSSSREALMGRLRNRVGELESYIPIDFGSQARDYADAAVGSIDEGAGVCPGEQFGEGGNYWIEGWVEVSNGDILRKSGIATGVTTGEVTHTNASLWVEYGDRAAYFVDQILVEQEDWSFAAPDDSGSAVDKNGKFVGLVFAGSGAVVAINKAEHIIEELGIAVKPIDGQYGLTLSSTPGGSVVTPGENTFIYNEETVVNLIAEPYQHYQFVKWTGDVSTVADVNAANTTIAMNSSYSITANFETLSPESTALLTLSSTTGGSIIFPDEGTSLHALGSDVSLVVQPDEGYQFVNRSGEVDAIADVNAASTTITMDSSYSIKANFSGGARCFIATAAYGTPMAEEIQALRRFRDSYLLTNAPGRAFVDLYYSTSPPVAEFITDHPSLKPVVRTALVPAVAMSTVALDTNHARKAVVMVLLLVSAVVAIYVIRRPDRGLGHSR
ncbi:MAG: CFI-box-CTERM domain-containing protein [Dehalococcoidia bacterium]